MFAIADGVTGLPNGAIASKTAIQELQQQLKNHNDINAATIIENINTKIFLEQQKRQILMATTLVTCIITKKQIIIFHIGDSRAYILTDTIWKTKDHTQIQDLIELGIITPQEATYHPEKNRLKYALGIPKKIQFEEITLDRKNQKILLCSDGLTDYIAENDLISIVQKYDTNRACNTLYNLAIKNGSTDDISIILIK